MPKPVNQAKYLVCLNRKKGINRNSRWHLLAIFQTEKYAVKFKYINLVLTLSRKKLQTSNLKDLANILEMARL